MSVSIKKNRTKVGSVLVVGGGIGGMQAALDLAESGFKVFLIQKESSIGGTMALLDKTFPTGDCSMCMLSPRVVEVARHPNIDTHTLCEVVSLEGEPGNFRAKIKQSPRYVDVEKCTGCGICEEKCVKTVESEYDQGLGFRKAIYSLFPQAYPGTKVIDKDNCIYFKTGRGRACEKFCPAKAIDFEQKEKTFEVSVGAVILATGMGRYDPIIRPELGYGRWPNVITSVQFERILSASGPYGGKITRPKDGKHPKRIAWIQCVGSRDFNRANPWCSSVCCMYATKQAVIAKEHDKDISTTIFYMDMRTFGKGFDRYVDRSKDEYGVKYQRAMISQVRDEVSTGNLILRYALENGSLKEETFDMVVLSIGFQPHYANELFLETFKIESDKYGFVRTSPSSPVDTSRKGVFVTGTCQGPKDIPETVIQGSAAAGRVMAFLSEVRGTEAIIKEIPPEIDVEGDEPQIGVFVCHCGINISKTVDIHSVVEDVRTLPNVAHVEDYLYACSQDSQDKIKDLIREKGLNRIVVASCTPRTHEALFQETIRAAGLNSYLFDLADIREQCAWCHLENKKKATDKAKKIVRMSIAKARKLRPLKNESVKVIPSALVIGGGLAGMTAALSIAEQGFEVHLVEIKDQLGGLAATVYHTIENLDVQSFLKETIERVESHREITVHKGVTIDRTDGFVGNFLTRLSSGESFVHGVVIVATGAVLYQPQEYLYGENPAILTQRELEERVQKGSFEFGKTYVMIQCVGSREEPYNYCSRVCCQDAIKNAIKIKGRDPAAQVFILYRDIRTYGLKEKYYRQARDLGVIFIRYEVGRKPEVIPCDKGLTVKIYDPVINEGLEVTTDYVVLSTGFRPHPGSEEVGNKLKLPLDQDGYFLEAHVKLRPVDFPSEGIFLCGLAHSPKNLDEGISQALAAAGRAGGVLSKKLLEIAGTIAKHDRSACVSCLACLRFCPYDSPYINEEGRVCHNEVKCKGCGICAGMCPAKAFQVNNFTDDQIISMIDALTEKPDSSFVLDFHEERIAV